MFGSGRPQISFRQSPGHYNSSSRSSKKDNDAKSSLYVLRQQQKLGVSKNLPKLEIPGQVDDSIRKKNNGPSSKGRFRSPPFLSKGFRKRISPRTRISPRYRISPRNSILKKLKKISPRNRSNKSTNLPYNNPQNPIKKEPVVCPMSPVGEKKLRLFPKIGAYRTKGYITADEERDLYIELQTTSSNPYSVVAEVENKLRAFKTKAIRNFKMQRDEKMTARRVDRENSKSEKSSEAAVGRSTMKSSSLKAKVTNDELRLLQKIMGSSFNLDSNSVMSDESSQKRPPASSKSRVARKEKYSSGDGSDKDVVTGNTKPKFRQSNQELPPLNSLTHRVISKSRSADSTRREKGPDIAYSDLPLNERVIIRASDIYGQADDDFVQNLFVEMCFFARLGFVQPPCCLRCAHQEGIHDLRPNLNCKAYVIWRNDANKLLHPNDLDDNLCLVECHAIRSLIEGNTVQDHTWDQNERRLIQRQKRGNKLYRE